MRVVTAVESLEKKQGEISIFLAGGIQKTEEWQKKVIAALYKEFKDIPLVVYNPRRENFPIHDPNAATEQITWEYDALEVCDIFSMYYAGNTTSDQPICMYEYGKHLERRSRNNDLDRFVVSAEPTYSRYQDVVIQTALVSKNVFVGKNLEEHINSIIHVIKLNLVSSRIIQGR